MIRADGIELAVESFGDPAHPPLLLIMGAMASMLWWPQAFCERLAGHGRYVIRYDNRDTGRSTTYEPGAPAYTLDDMADDVVRVLDGCGIPAAHVVGMSMGGTIAQIAALKHRVRVASLIVISSSPLGEDTSDLPGISPTYRQHAARFGAVDWSDRASAIDFLVEDSCLLAGSRHPFDPARVRRLVERDYDRAGNFPSITNHVMLTGGERWKGRLREIGAPLLVIHGTDDPIFPVEHGVALSTAAAGASIVRLDGGGHELHEADWNEIITAIVAHTRRSPTSRAGAMTENGHAVETASGGARNRQLIAKR